MSGIPIKLRDTLARRRRSAQPRARAAHRVGGGDAHKSWFAWARALAGESHVLALLKREHAAKHSAHAVVEEEDTAEAVHPVLLSGDVEILKRRVIDGHAVDKWSTRWWWWWRRCVRLCVCVHVRACARAFAVVSV